MLVLGGVLVLEPSPLLPNEITQTPFGKFKLKLTASHVMPHTFDNVCLKMEFGEPR